MRFSTLGDWLQWQETLHPTGMDLGLERCRRVQHALGWAQQPFRIITVAGTNGKGSTVAFLDSILRASGYRTGTYTSPHLVRYNERISIDGVYASDAALMESFERLDEARGATTITYFEYGTLAAIDLFRRSRIDVAILEVGIGGGLDAVNVFDPDVSVITAIDIDHVKWLGQTREIIGEHKAGILRPLRPVVIAEREPPRSVLARATAIGAPVFRLGREFHAEPESELEWSWRGAQREFPRLRTPGLVGAFQLDNAAGAIMALEALGREFPMTWTAVDAGVRQARLRGRFERLPGLPERILDIAHNPHAARSLAVSLQAERSGGRTHAVLAMLKDKDYGSVLRVMLPHVDAWYLASLPGERAASGGDLRDALDAAGCRVPMSVHRTVREAQSAAVAASSPEDRIVTFGSCYTVGEVLEAEELAASEASACVDSHL